LFIDACYSGSAGGRTFATIPAHRALNAFPRLEEITGKGRLIVAAAGKGELANESETLQHGIFTHSLIEALRGRDRSLTQGYTTFDELFSYVERTVPAKARDLLSCEQHPLYKGEVQEQIQFPLLQGFGCRTLLDFPHAFTPLVVVVGDRREPEVKSAGDLF